MPTLTRNNAWNKGGTFDNPDLLWYAKGVRVMQSRKFNDLTSWWFFAAMHAQLLFEDDDPTKPLPRGYPNWWDIPAPPAVPTTDLPTGEVMKKYWDQCQHGTWFFPPWHRGYLYAFENVMRAAIKSLPGAPSDWTLPYWNYFGTGQFKMPPAFAQQNMPDGTPNPLFVKARFGPLNDGNIFIRIGPTQINQQCQQSTVYTGGNSSGSSGDYGGGETGFSNFESPPLFGGLEYNPHNGVHTNIGGQFPNGDDGVMGNPQMASLDPIFYLHHCNIDRMWAAWNNAHNQNPTDANWLNGPTANGDRKFVMPNPDSTPWEYTPAMVNDISQLNYDYAEPDSGVTVPALAKTKLRLRNLGLLLDDDKEANDMGDTNRGAELVGASTKHMTVDASGAHTTIKLDNKGWRSMTDSLQFASLSSLPDEVYLLIEGIKGNRDSIVCSVTVNQLDAGHLYLFGLSMASKKDGHHGGAGLTIKLDITKIVDQLHLDNALAVETLDVVILPSNIIAKGSELTISRIGIYRIAQAE